MAMVVLYTTYGIDRSLWLDEANTVDIAKSAPVEILDKLSRDVSPPLYYLLLSPWTKLLGDSETALRGLAIFFYLAGIGATWCAGVLLLGAEGARLAAFLYAVNPIVGRQAQNVRMYTLASLLASLSFALFLRIRNHQSVCTRDYVLFGIVTFLGLNTHYWFVFVLAGYGGSILFTWSRWNARKLSILALITFVPFL